MNFVGQAVRIAIGLVLPPFILHQIGRESYGLVVMVTTVLGFVALVQMGTPQALNRFIAEEVARKNREGLLRVLNTGGVLLAIAGALGAIVVAVMIAMPGLLLSIPEGTSISTIRGVVLMMGVTSVVCFPLSLGNAVLIAHRRFKFFNLNLVATMLVRMGLVFGLLTLFPASLLAYVSANCVTIIMPVAIAFLLIRRIVPDFRLNLKHVTKSAMKQIGGYGIQVFLLTLAWMLFISIDYFLIGKVLGNTSVTSFSMAQVWSRLLHGTIAQALTVLVPVAAAAGASGNLSDLQAMLTRGSKYSIMICAPAIVFLMVFRYRLMSAWLGPGFDETAMIMMPILIGDLFLIAGNSAAQMAVGMGKVSRLTLVNLGLGAVNIICVLTVLKLGMGLMAVGYIYMGLFLLRGGIIYPVFMIRTLNIPWKGYFLNVYVRPTVSGALLLPIVYLLYAFMPLEGWPNLLLSAGATTLMFIPLTYFVAFDSYDRHMVVGLLKRLKVWR